MIRASWRMILWTTTLTPVYAAPGRIARCRVPVQPIATPEGPKRFARCMVVLAERNAVALRGLYTTRAWSAPRTLRSNFCICRFLALANEIRTRDVVDMRYTTNMCLSHVETWTGTAMIVGLELWYGLACGRPRYGVEAHQIKSMKLFHQDLKRYRVESTL